MKTQGAKIRGEPIRTED